MAPPRSRESAAETPHAESQGSGSRNGSVCQRIDSRQLANNPVPYQMPFEPWRMS
jgi:hypothetical protein